MKNLRNYMALVLAVIMCFGLMATTASAASYVTVELNDPSFDDAWEISIEYTANGRYLGVLVFGYDTWWIKEDYAWTKSAVGSSQAGVYRPGRDDSINWGSEKAADKYSKSEVTHKQEDVVYCAYFSDGDSSIEILSMYSSSVK